VASSSDSSTALQEVDLQVGSGFTTNLQATSAAAATGRTVDGISDTKSTVTQAVVALDSTIEVGAQATLQVVQAATTKAEAISVGGATSTAAARFDDGTGAGGAAAGAFGGLIDTTANAKDLSVGSAAQIVVSVDDSAAATATNTAGAATASAIAPGIDGLYAITAEIGTSGALQAQVAADFVATASTVGTSPVSGNAEATASAARVSAITANNDASADPSTISFGAGGSIKATAGVAADPIALAATATSVATDATATTAAAQVAGITDQGSLDGVINSGAALTLEVSAATTQVAKATTVEGAAKAAGGSGGSTTGPVAGDVVYGVQIGKLDVGTDTNLVATAVGNLAATATTTAGAADAAATLPVSAAAMFKDFLVGDAATVLAQADMKLDARATSTGGTATASSENPNEPVTGLGSVAGFQAVNGFQVGTEGQLDGRGTLQATATAVSVAGDSTANTVTSEADSRGVVLFSPAGSTDPLSIGGDAQIRGTAISAVAASAQTVGAVGAAADATAQVGGTPTGTNLLFTAGLDFSGAVPVQLGQDANLNGLADLQRSALAQTVTGDGLAGAFSDRTIGMVSNTPLSVGESAVINLTASMQGTAKATTVDGSSTGTEASNVLAGLYADGGPPPRPIAMGQNLQFNSQATGNSAAFATSIDAGAGAAAKATVNQDQVYGVGLSGETISAGSNTSFRSIASSTQLAQASNNGPAGTPNNGAAIATVAEEDWISGVDGANLKVGIDLNGYTAKASLGASASTSNIAATGDSKASVGVSTLGTFVRGVNDGDITVGGNVVGPVGIDSQAVATLTATSKAVSGPATAGVGDALSGVIGVDSSAISVGGKLPLLAQAQGVVSSDAVSVAGVATSNANQSSIGLRQSSLDVGTIGEVRSLASLANTVTARSVLGNSVINGTSTVLAVDGTNMTFGSSATLTFTSSGQGRVGSETVSGDA
jgi:hypothetical protein